MLLLYTCNLQNSFYFCLKSFKDRHVSKSSPASDDSAQANGEHIPFTCNSPNEFRVLGIKRVFMLLDYVYVLLENEHIYFKAPFCYFDSEKRNVCAMSRKFKEDNKFEWQRAGNSKFRSSLIFTFCQFNQFSCSVASYQILTLCRIFDEEF